MAGLSYLKQVLTRELWDMIEAPGRMSEYDSPKTAFPESAFALKKKPAAMGKSRNSVDLFSNLWLGNCITWI